MGRRGRVKQLIKTVTSRHGVPKPCRGIHQGIEARKVMEVTVPLIIVQFQQDFFCNPKKYPNWYGRIIAAVEARRAEPSFYFLNLPGNHDDAENLATHSRCEGDHPQLGVVTAPDWADALLNKEDTTGEQRMELNPGNV